MGPHPAVAEVRRAVRTALAELTGTPPRATQATTQPASRQRVLVACSGGADSVALAAAVAFEAARAGLPAGLVTVDHGLQPGSAEQAAQVAGLGYELGLDPVETVPVRVGRRGGPEAAARAARYAVLDAAAQALDAVVLLGHTRDDQAETVLLGLGRGSGPRSIAGMRRWDGRYLRPLLGVRRATTRAACTALGLPIWDDPHNADPGYQRVRLRREVLPLLEQVLQGGVAEALARTADLLREDLDALDEVAARFVGWPAGPQADGPWSAAEARNAGLDVGELARQPRAVRTRVLRVWVGGLDAPALSATHLAALDALVSDWHGQGPAYLPGGLRVRRASGRLVVDRVAHPAASRAAARAAAQPAVPPQPLDPPE